MQRRIQMMLWQRNKFSNAFRTDLRAIAAEARISGGALSLQFYRDEKIRKQLTKKRNKILLPVYN
jgi:L-rhamnose isomerase